MERKPVGLGRQFQGGRIMFTKYGTEILELGPVTLRDTNRRLMEVMAHTRYWSASILIHAIADSLEARARLDELGVDYKDCVVG